MNTSKYEYTDKDQLNSPHKYMYTSYLGKDFLITYFTSRNEFIERDDPSKDMAMPEIIRCLGGMDMKDHDVKSVLAGFAEKEKKIDTTEVLADLALILLNDDIEDDHVYSILDPFCGRYEVSKRIYDSYIWKGERLKPDSERYQTLANYALLSFCMIHYYEISKNLKFLNCALKVNDLLCSLSEEKLEPEALRTLIVHNLLAETKHIENIMKRSGVEI